MKENYVYPIDYDRPKDEIITLIAMFQAVEEAYETGIATQKLNEVYRQFKTIVPSIGEEKRLGREFEAVSGYSLYRVIQEAKQTQGKKVKMKR